MALKAKFSNYENVWKTHGYIETKKIYDMSYAGVKYKLYQLLKNSEEIKEERILLKIDAEPQKWEEVYLVNPVLMSLIIGDYECTEQLLDMGYGVDDRCFETQLYMICKSGDLKHVEEYEISITQWLFAKEEIPKHLRERICEILGCLRPVFDFRYDYWENPFSNNVASDNVLIIPPYFCECIDSEEDEWEDEEIFDFDIED